MSDGKSGSICVFVVAILLLSCAAVMAQQFVYPQKGQSAEQQQKDEYECHTWAVQQTKYDPTTAAQAAPAQPAQTSTGAQPGSGLRGAAKGAVVGGVIGAIGDDAGKGAGIGAVAGGVAGRSQSRRQQAQQQTQSQQQASATQQGQQDAYLRAKATCLEAKGYSVK
ncbi:glycine zipper domain-containing protein [Desulfomicrobium sp. ZS1]|uniref:glycine zipper domain-containing protein n=1 Tax=Desulfomicrobium sp. ZS1 TaxID=2952228 RepID=UPI0020B3D1EC|nr:glycine zipper domain-containing protein [Desulfomicrobium sp. ZS1]UTF49137.1 glycine zipper domain-containing protein [Desulfomicrobium sp. ZS1]